MSKAAGLFTEVVKEAANKIENAIYEEVHDAEAKGFEIGWTAASLWFLDHCPDVRKDVDWYATNGIEERDRQIRERY